MKNFFLRKKPPLYYVKNPFQIKILRKQSMCLRKTTHYVIINT